MTNSPLSERGKLGCDALRGGAEGAENTRGAWGAVGVILHMDCEGEATRWRTFQGAEAQRPGNLPGGGGPESPRVVGTGGVQEGAGDGQVGSGHEVGSLECQDQ